MHGLDPGLAQVQLNIKGEIRRIDTDEHIRACFDQGLDQCLAPLEQLTQATQHLDQAHHRQALHREVRHQALGLHQWATDPNETDLRMTCLESTHQSGAKNIAAGLTRHQRYTEFSHDQRVMPRVEFWIDLRNTSTSGNWAAGSVSSAIACSTVSPWR
ncbi:hypothetical protein D3C79_747810 [compost metagenome]